MNGKNIELEFRAEVLKKDKERLKKQFEKSGVLLSHTKRLSVMYFGEISRKKIDLRVRITNGKAELVVKTGSFSSHDRIEFSQKINPDQFLGMVKILTFFDFSQEVGERETFNYKFPNNITVSLVSAGPIIYVELEKMSSKEDADEDTKELNNLAHRFKLKVMNDKEFNILCERLSKTVDWTFHASENEYQKLKRLIDNNLNHIKSKKMAKS